MKLSIAVFLLTTTSLFGVEPHLISLLEDATQKSHEIIDSQPQPQEFSTQELSWLNKEAERRWGVPWQELSRQGQLGAQRRELLLRWLNTVIADSPGPAPSDAKRQPPVENWVNDAPWDLPRDPGSRWHP